MLTYGKLRAAYGQSGTQPAPYLLASTFVTWTSADGGWGPSIGSSQDGAGGLVTNYNLPTSDLGPERVKEFETGFDLGLLKDQADLSLTYYRCFSTDVILNVPVAGSTGYTEKPANAAELRNFGWEVALNIRPVNHRDCGIRPGPAVGPNMSLVTDLAGVQFAPLPFSGGTNGLSVQSVAVKNQRLGVLHGVRFRALRPGLTRQRHRHRPHGGSVPGGSEAARCTSMRRDTPSSIQSQNYIIGDPNPDWTGSVRAGFRWKKTFGTGLVDMRHGGQAHNGTRGALNHFGTSKESQELRDGGNYVFGSTYFRRSTSPGPAPAWRYRWTRRWFTGAGGIFNGDRPQFLEDAIFVKLREISSATSSTSRGCCSGLGFNSMEIRLAGRNLHHLDRLQRHRSRDLGPWIGLGAARGGLLQQPADPVVDLLPHPQPLRPIMTRSRKLVMCAALTLLSAACDNFLTGPGIDQDPNGSTELLKPGPLYTAIQALQSVQFEGQLARSATMYMQQVSGNARQQVGYDRGFIAPPDIDTYFSAVYGTSRTITGGGGLLDIRKMEQLGQPAERFDLRRHREGLRGPGDGDGRRYLGRHSLSASGGFNHRNTGI